MSVPEKQMGELRLEVECFGAAVLALTARGELDITTAPALREQLARVLEDQPETLVLDLTNISFTDSVALCDGVELPRRRSPRIRLEAAVRVCSRRDESHGARQERQPRQRDDGPGI